LRWGVSSTTFPPNRAGLLLKITEIVVGNRAQHAAAANPIHVFDDEHGDGLGRRRARCQDDRQQTH
jgi:hypothetical protein